MIYRITGGPLDGGEIEGPDVPIGSTVGRAVQSGVRNPFTNKVTKIPEAPMRFEVYTHIDIGELRYEIGT